MEQLDVLVPYVVTHLSGAPEIQVILYLRRAAKQFCQDTSIWRVSMGTQSVTAPTDNDAYLRISIPNDDLTLPDQSIINSIGDLKLDGDSIDISRYRYNIVTQQIEFEPQAFYETKEMEVFAILEPTRSATTIPDFLVERWGEGIADYCIWEMMSMINREWSAPGIAIGYKAKYQSRVAEATVQYARRGTDKGIRLEPRPFV